MRYNIKREIEFSSFDVSDSSDVFFDYKNNAYIMDQNYIIDMQ